MGYQLASAAGKVFDIQVGIPILVRRERYFFAVRRPGRTDRDRVVISNRFSMGAIKIHDAQLFSAPAPFFKGNLCLKDAFLAGEAFEYLVGKFVRDEPAVLNPAKIALA